MQKAKYSLFPIVHQNLWDYYTAAKKSYWTPEEIDYPSDIPHLAKLNKDELHFIKHVLGFFAQSDTIVNENLAIRFYKDVQIEEARAFYAMQMAIEAIHAETYAKLIETYIPNDDERMKLFNAIENFPTIGKKAKWAVKYIDSQEDFALRLLAFACVEGIFFSGSFCAIFWLKSRGICPALCSANKFISRDEGMHWTFAAELFKTMKLELTEREAHTIVSEAVEIESDFVSKALPVRLIGMNDNLMIQYIKYTADRVLQSIGHPKLYNSEQPFDFMKMIDLETKGNFFERRIDSYQIPTEKKIDFGVDF